jgi:hypothetical protein
MKYLGSLSALALLPLLSTAVSAQSFNIDVGDNLIIFPVPPSTYVAGANQAGIWNDCHHPYTTSLVDLAGAATTVTTSSDITTSYNDFPSPLTGVDRDFMCDIQTFGGSLPQTVHWTFSGLQDGPYNVYTYAWDSSPSSYLTTVTVDNSADAPQAVGGPWSGGAHVQGTTYALHHVIVIGGTLTLHADNQPGHAGAINGFQLVYNGPLTTGFCFGDGSGTACPCGNAGSSGHGCASSVSAVGAQLTSQGTASLAADTVVLNGSDMPSSSALYFQGTAKTNGGAGAVFGDGLRCAGGSVVRLGTTTNVAGASHYPNPGNPSVSVKGNVTSPGLREYQVWYRNAAAFCTPSTFNLSNGIEVTWTP